MVNVPGAGVRLHPPVRLCKYLSPGDCGTTARKLIPLISTPLAHRRRGIFRLGYVRSKANISYIHGKKNLRRSVVLWGTISPMASKPDFVRRRLLVHQKYAPFLEAADTTRQEKADIRQQMDNEYQAIAEEESRYIDSILFRKARRLDVDRPASQDNDLWNDSVRPPTLTPKGRLALRKAIDDERVRRREVAAWWWKTVIIPGIAAITGLVGTLTGLFAVLHHSNK